MLTSAAPARFVPCSYLKKMAPMNLILEMEIGITGGVEDGVDNSGVDNSKLYSTPEDTWAVYEALHPISEKFTIAAAFGNVHGVYKPGNVKLQPELLDSFQKHGTYAAHLQHTPRISNTRRAPPPLDVPDDGCAPNLGRTQWWLCSILDLPDVIAVFSLRDRALALYSRREAGRRQHQAPILRLPWWLRLREERHCLGPRLGRRQDECRYRHPVGLLGGHP